MYCGCDSESILVSLTDAGKERIMCPNCIAKALKKNKISFKGNMNLVDDVTGIHGAVKFQCLGTSEQYTLTPRRMLRLLAHDLCPNEWKVLSEKYGTHNFMLHSDFYTEDGWSIQPIKEITMYVWYDIVEIKGKCYAEHFEISGKKDGDDIYQIDDFYAAVAVKHNVDIDDIKTYMMDGINFNVDEMPYGAESCGCYINGELW